jgi:hypothetical protein
MEKKNKHDSGDFILSKVIKKGTIVARKTVDQVNRKN